MAISSKAILILTSELFYHLVVKRDSRTSKPVKIEIASKDNAILIFGIIQWRQIRTLSGQFQTYLYQIDNSERNFNSLLGVITDHAVMTGTT